MNLFRRVWNSIGLNDRFDDAEYEYEYEEELSPEFYSPEELYPAEQRPETVNGGVGTEIGNNVVGMPKRRTAQTEMCLMEPRSFEEMPQAVVALRERKSVILNLSLIDADVAQRCVDFVAGATFAMDGHQERLGEHIFLFTPSFVHISSYPSAAQSVARSPIQSTQINPPASAWTSQPRMVQ